MVSHENSAGTGHSCLENDDVDPADTIKSRLRRAHPYKDEDEESPGFEQCCFEEEF